MVDPSLQNLSSREREMLKDAQGRALCSSMLILDEIPGTLNQMIAQTYDGQTETPPEFGKEILDIARRLQPESIWADRYGASSTDCQNTGNTLFC